MKRTIVVGDIHGCYREFQELLELVKYKVSSDNLILVGDLVNKGENSRRVLELAVENKAQVILGNHELGFLKNFEKGASINSKYFKKLKENLEDKLDFWVQWMRELPYFIERENFIVVHAGVIPEVSLEETSVEILTKIRTWDGVGEDLNNEINPPWYELYKKEKLIIYGHWAKQGLLVRKNTVGLDTGCCYGDKLSAIVLPEKKSTKLRQKENIVSLIKNSFLNPLEKDYVFCRVHLLCMQIDQIHHQYLKF